MRGGHRIEMPLVGCARCMLYIAYKMRPANTKISIVRTANRENALRAKCKAFLREKEPNMPGISVYVQTESRKLTRRSIRARSAWLLLRGKTCFARAIVPPMAICARATTFNGSYAPPSCRRVCGYIRCWMPCALRVQYRVVVVRVSSAPRICI